MGIPTVADRSPRSQLELVASRANSPKTAFVALPLIVALPELPEFDKRRPGRRRLGAGPAVVVLVPSRAPAPARLAAVQVQGDCDLIFVAEINLKLFELKLMDSIAWVCCASVSLLFLKICNDLR